MFSQAIADTICERLCAGDSLRAICRDNAMPAASTVLDWTAAHPEFGEQYARARERGYQLLADEIMDDVSVTSPMDVPAARLKFDAKRWMLSKMLPKVYGDKLDVEHKGSVAVKLDSGDGGVL